MSRCYISCKNFGYVTTDLRGRTSTCNATACPQGMHLPHQRRRCLARGREKRWHGGNRRSTKMWWDLAQAQVRILDLYRLSVHARRLSLGIDSQAGGIGTLQNRSKLVQMVQMVQTSVGRIYRFFYLMSRMLLNSYSNILLINQEDPVMPVS